MVEHRLELGNEHSHCSEAAVCQNEVRGSRCGPDDICNFCFKHSWFNMSCGSGLGYRSFRAGSFFHVYLEDESW